MRLYWQALSSLLYASLITVQAIHPQLISRQSINPFKPGPQPSRVSTGSRFPRRAPDDLCATINTSLLADLQPLVHVKLPASALTFDSQVCLCIKDLDSYLNSDINMVILTNFVERSSLKDYLSVLIGTSPNRQDCVPDSHACSEECELDDGLDGGLCACASSSISCGGDCGRPTDGCAPLYALKNEAPPTSARVATGCEAGEVGCRATPPENKRAYMPRRVARVKARDTESESPALDIHVVIDLAHLMRALNSLRVHSGILRKNPTTPETSVVLAHTDKIVKTSTKLFLVHTSGSFFNLTMELLLYARRLENKLSLDCDLADDHHFDDVRADAGVLISLTSDMLHWHHIADEHGSSGSTSSDVPIVISLSRLLADLGLGDIKTSIAASGLGELSSDVNAILDGLSIGPGGERGKENARGLGLDALVQQVEGLVGLVLKLGDLDFLLSPKTLSSTKRAALAPISLATLGLMSSTDIAGLSNSLDLVVFASTNARTALSQYGDCGNLVDELSLVAKTAIAIKVACEDFTPSEAIDLPFLIPALEPASPLAPVTSPALRASTTDTLVESKEAPVVIVLDGLLHHLGLGGVSANMTVSGLSPGLSGTLNGILRLLNAGGSKLAARDGGVSFSSVVFSDAGLARAFMVAVESAIDLESKSTTSGPVASLLAGLLPPVLASLQAVLGSPTAIGLVSAVDGLLASAKKMDKSFTSCNCSTGPVSDSSERFVAAVMDIQGWVNDNPDVVRTEGADM